MNKVFNTFILLLYGSFKINRSSIIQLSNGLKFKALKNKIWFLHTILATRHHT